jgi:hypothetical protein
MESEGSQHVERKGYSVCFAREADHDFVVAYPPSPTKGGRVCELTSVQRCDQVFRVSAAVTAGARHDE